MLHLLHLPGSLCRNPLRELFHGALSGTTSLFPLSSLLEDPEQAAGPHTTCPVRDVISSGRNLGAKTYPYRYKGHFFERFQPFPRIWSKNINDLLPKKFLAKYGNFLKPHCAAVLPKLSQA